MEPTAWISAVICLPSFPLMAIRCVFAVGFRREGGSTVFSFSSIRAIGITRVVCKNLCGTHVLHASDPTDARLLQRIAARDTAALTELYDRHSRLIFGLILRVVRDRGEAEDLLQETFVRVWTRAATYDAMVGGPLPWIVRVARNCAIDRVRARRVRADIDAPVMDVAAVEATTAATDIESPEATILIAERSQTLSNALAGLPADQQQLIEAAFFEGYTHSELAQRFKLPLGTVKTRIRAGMIAMRKRLEHAV
jgi:RNA polymerase sigma-70 factor (ECF subfamily)